MLITVAIVLLVAGCVAIALLEWGIAAAVDAIRKAFK